jgi:phage terminase large subunit-like protein
MVDAYGGTRLGRQELDGEMVEDVEGALWSRALIEQCRVILPGTGRWRPEGLTKGARCHAPNPLHHASHGLPPRSGEDFRRVVIGVDPPASAAGTCGIVACGLGDDGLGYVLGDHSVGGLSPEGWARAVSYAAELHGADRVVAESNQGGAMVESVLRSADVTLPVKSAHARLSKGRRAEPVAILFEKGKARFAGAFPELEDQLCGLTLGGGYEGPGGSPDRADAMVWAMAELMLAPPRAEPRIILL